MAENKHGIVNGVRSTNRMEAVQSFKWLVAKLQKQVSYHMSMPNQQERSAARGEVTSSQEIPQVAFISFFQICNFHRWLLHDLQRSAPQRCPQYGRFPARFMFHMVIHSSLKFIYRMCVRTKFLCRLY